MKNKLKEDLKEAMKAKDVNRKMVISNLLAAIGYKEIELKKKELSNKDIIDVILKQQKIAKEQIKTCDKNRTDLLEVYQKELDIISSYCPSKEDLLAERMEEINSNDKIKKKTKAICGYLKKEDIDLETFKLALSKISFVIPEESLNEMKECMPNE